MTPTYTVLVVICALSIAAHGQVVPAATSGPRQLPISGNVQYAMRYSHQAVFGSALPDYQTAIASADVSYTNAGERFPFNIMYSGGYGWTVDGPPQMTGFFQHLYLSQAFKGRKWNAVVSNDVSYRPEAPLTGFSGIPGTGEPVGGQNPGTSSQSILTTNTHTVDESVQAIVERRLTHAISLSAGGGSEFLRYPDGNGMDTNTQMARTEVTDRLNARNYLSAEYSFSRFSFLDQRYSLLANTALAGMRHVWSAKVESSISAGPQWMSSPNSLVFPSSTGVAANASVAYQFRFVSAGLSYMRGISGGAGFLPGGRVDSVNGYVSRQLGRELLIGISGSHMRTASLQSNGAANANIGSVQAIRRFGRYLSLFVNYTAIEQSSTAVLPANAVSGIMHVVGAGIQYSPESKHLRK